jgi:hypothetical protein
VSGTEQKLERERLRDAKRKPVVTREHVDTLMAAMTDEGRAHVAAMAVYRTAIRPATWPR